MLTKAIFPSVSAPIRHSTWGGWEKYFTEAFPHWSHHHLQDFFAKERMHISAKGLAYFGCLWKELDVEQQQRWGSAIPVPAGPRARCFPWSEPFYCLTLQSSRSSRAGCLPWVLSPVPKAPGLAKVGKCQFTVLILHHLEADTLLRT